jgi:drug/metabolite transporter (DMT)-like permease
MKIALVDMGAFQFGALRTLIGGMLLFGLAFALRRPVRIREMGSVALMGLLQTTGFTGLIILALVSGGAGKSAVLAYTMPFWVMLLAWPLLGDRLHGWQWPSAAATLAGLLCILDPLHLAGDLLSTVLATLAGVCWALAVIVAKRLQARAPDLDVLAIAAWQSLIGSVPLVVLALWWPAPPINWTPSLDRRAAVQHRARHGRSPGCCGSMRCAACRPARPAWCRSSPRSSACCLPPGSSASVPLPASWQACC